MLDLDKVSARVQELSTAYRLKVEPDAYVWQLSVGEQQRVEILKALYRGASFIIHLPCVSPVGKTPSVPQQQLSPRGGLR